MEIFRLVVIAIFFVLGICCAVCAVWAAKRRSAETMLIALIGAGGMLIINFLMFFVD